ncbi:caspase-8-like [Branchiostoma floridae]|uniref:Caspase-8-like n=2 Tax=Branchiostoma floridae TaxID=7739 RepID=A0A9J7LCT1_BRAFL|nr:caspase-8-like [Branchiostoma floridae]
MHLSTELSFKTKANVRLSEENSNLKNQAEADKREMRNLTNQREADKRKMEQLRNQRDADRRKMEKLWYLLEQLVEQREADRRMMEQLKELKVADKREMEQLKEQKEADRREMEQLKEQKGADKREKEQLKEQKEADKREMEQLSDLVEQLKEQKGADKREKEQLKEQREAGRREMEQQREADRREMEQLMEQKEADRREKEQLKEQIASLSTKFTCSYDMSRSPRGIAVIINNINFEDMPRRDGAEGDTDRLREAFESLNFKVFIFHDLDQARMVATMKEQGRADHSNYDCFVCCIMSHGTGGMVYSSDDVGIDISQLMKPVNAKKCPSLKGKPKLFFIQACQGEKLQGRESFDGDYDVKPVLYICHEADFFLGLATVPGYVAVRFEDGAPYVWHLAKLLKDFGPTHDLSTIMAMVCDKMNNSGWISSNHSTLRKNIIFSAN